MIARKSRVVAAAAAITLGAAALLTPAASAANKQIVVWTDETRGPTMDKLLTALPPNIAGYDIKIKAFSSLVALDSAWANVTSATGPDLIISNSAYATQGAKDGKLLPITLPASIKSQFSAGALATLSYKGSLYGVPLDMDTTAMYVNKNLVKTLPSTFGDMVNFYAKNKAKFSAGLCVMDGVWGTYPVITALGGYAWGTRADGSPNIMAVGLDEPKFLANFKKYLLAKNGKSSGFLSWNGTCKPDFLAGKIPFANSGGWQLADVKKALGTNFTVMPVPGLTKGTAGSPWTGFQGIYVTTYSQDHGVSAGAMQFAVQYMASAKTQATYTPISNRPAANIAAAKEITDPAIAGFALAGSKYGTTQRDMFLNNNASGANWYDILTDAYTKTLVNGQSAKSIWTKAAQNAQMNFVAGYKE